MTREDAINIVRNICQTDAEKEALATLIPELRESEDERIRKLLVWQVYRNIEDETNDLAQSVYDGIKGHDPDLEESIEDWKKCLAYLEKQKEQKPAEWSERDEKILASAMSHIADSQCFDHFHDISKEDIYTWLKSLRPRPHWKPSKEQMDALDEYIWAKEPNKNKAKGVISLYEDLKKLM